MTCNTAKILFVFSTMMLLFGCEHDDSKNNEHYRANETILQHIKIKDIKNLNI